MEVLNNSLYFGAFISIVSYGTGVYLKNKFKKSIFNPLLISIVFIIIFLSVLNVDYESYYEGAKYISYLLTPATVCLAIPLYQQLKLLKNNFKAIMSGIIAGVFTSLGSILLLSILFQFTHVQYVTILPKSITTAIGMVVSQELGGIATITVATILITGIFGNVAADFIFKIFKITEPIAKGVALGTASHVVGTSKAMELGEVEGAMSSLSIAVAGIITVVLAPIFANFL